MQAVCQVKISLTPTLSKVLEPMVGRWMLSKVADKFDARQFGVLRGRSTTHALIDITHMWHKALDAGNSIRALFVDYSKAFDHVDHSTVLRKIATLDIHPCLLKWMYPCYSIACSEWKLVTIIRIGSRSQEECHEKHGSGHMSFRFLSTIQVLSWLLSSLSTTSLLQNLLINLT